MSDAYNFDPQATPNVMGYLNPLMAATMQVPPSPTMAGPNAGAAMGPSPHEIAAARLAAMGGGGGNAAALPPEVKQQNEANLTGMLPYVGPAQMAYDAIAPTATAGDDPFGAIKESDPQLYQSYHNRYANVRGVGGNATERAQSRIDQRNAITGEFGKFMGDRANAQQKAATDTAAYDAWKTQNADAINGLGTTERDLVRQAPTLPEASEMLTRGLNKQREAKETLGERYPGMVYGLEGLGALGSFLLPGVFQKARTAAVQSAANDARQSYLNAYGPGTRASQKTAAAASLDANILRNQLNPSGSGLMRSAAGIGGEVALPYAFGNIPNAIDATMGMYSSDPGAKEKMDKAFSNMLDWKQGVRSLGEGALGTIIGHKFGNAGAGYEKATSMGQGVLDQFEAQAQKEAAKSAMRKSRPVTKLKVVPSD